MVAGAHSALSAGSPPAALVGRPLKRMMTGLGACGMAPAAATPGRQGKAARGASQRPGQPGLTAQHAPARVDASPRAASAMVPAPAKAPGTRATAARQPGAAGVPGVPPGAAMPPATSAQARRAVWHRG